MDQICCIFLTESIRKIKPVSSVAGDVSSVVCVFLVLAVWNLICHVKEFPHIKSVFLYSTLYVVVSFVKVLVSPADNYKIMYHKYAG